ncbi:MAG: superoxide dismutase family protein [Ferruginibacter sp.]
MKKSIFLNLVTGGLLLMTTTWVSCNSGETSNTAATDSTAATTEPMAMAKAMATLTGTMPDTTLNGTVEFDAEAGGQVKMKLELMVPSKANKSVAVHIHQMGDCGDMGKMTGGHWNPTNQSHGKWGSASFHSGDIGNISLDNTGKGSLELTSNLWSIGGDSTTNILDRAIIVHGGVDDYTSQPAGNSGARIGCGVIKKSN